MMPKKINRLVTTAQGTFEGIPQGNPAFTVFKGVPYAKPPVGEWRFRHAQPAERFEGVRKCDTFPPIAVQNAERDSGCYNKEFFPAVVPMSEDCLYLNIWTPDVSADAKLPVMLWIHGGGYTAGYGYEMEMDGEAFSRRGVILVTVTYRLGALGFMAHPELSRRCPIGISGNMAVSDCVEALKWIQKNISAFGGDPSNVTVFGQSAGGGMTQAMLASPATKGLFTHAIVQSAGGISTLGGEVTLKDMEDIGALICEKMGKTIDELIAMDAYELTVGIEKVMFENRMFMRMVPCVDNMLLNGAPGAVIAAGKHHNVDIMTGSVGGDGGLFARSNDPEVQRAASMVTPRAWAKAETLNGRKPLHIYYFDRKLPGGDGAESFKDTAFHSSELWYVFGTLNRCWRSTDPGFEAGDYILSERMTSYWANFAKTGDPNGEGLPRWSSYTPEHPMTMHFNEKTVAEEDMSGDKVVEDMADKAVKEALGK